MASGKNLILNHLQIEQKINRIAYEIFENNFEEKEIIIAGISKNGYLFAKKLDAALKKICKIKVQLIELIIDKENPYNKKVNYNPDPSEIKNRVILVADDVLNSGKTLIFGIRVFLNAPVKKISTVVLVNRAHQRYPVKANYVGLNLSTTLKEHIKVKFEGKGKDCVYLE